MKEYPIFLSKNILPFSIFTCSQQLVGRFGQILCVLNSDWFGRVWYSAPVSPVCDNAIAVDYSEIERIVRDVGQLSYIVS